MNNMNKVNLKLLANWLLENHERLVETKAFDMDNFRGTESSYCDFVSETDCGTVGCALGWAPVTGIKALATEVGDFYGSSLSFSDYCVRVFGIGTGNSNFHYWEWCFSDSWVEWDNTPKGAAIRIMYLLNNEDVVDTWGEDERYFSECIVRDYMSWWDKEGDKML